MMTRIAICDDEAWVRQQLEACLTDYASEKQRDFEILLFSDANILLREYPANLDLLLLDIAMNGLDGVEAAGELRKLDESVTIIFITSMANRRSTQKKPWAAMFSFSCLVAPSGFPYMRSPMPRCAITGCSSISAQRLAAFGCP